YRPGCCRHVVSAEPGSERGRFCGPLLRADETRTSPELGQDDPWQGLVPVLPALWPEGGLLRQVVAIERHRATTRRHRRSRAAITSQCQRQNICRGSRPEGPKRLELRRNGSLAQG